MPAASDAAPIAPSIASQTATEGRGFGFSVPRFNDPDGDALTYTFSGLPAWLRVSAPEQNPRYISGTPPFTESSATNNKTYTITVTAENPNGSSESTSFTLTVLNVNRSPVPPTIANKVAYEAKPFGYSVPMFSDPDGDALTYAFSGLPAWLRVSSPETNPRYVSGTPPLSESSPVSNTTYVVTLTATDTSGASASKSFNVVVADNRYPVPGTITNQTATENVAFSYNMPAFTDPDGDAITYTFYGLPAWLKVADAAVNPRYISGKPTFTESTRTQQMSYTITVNARDAVGQTTQRSFTLTVVNVNRPPAAPAIPSQTAYENSAYSLNAPRFSDPDGDPLTYSFAGLPTWLKVTDPAVNDRYISGRPPFSEATPDTPAQYSITMTATDLDGASTGQTIALTVMNVAQGPKAVVTPGSLAFENQLVGTSSASQAVTLSNEGESPLSVGSVSVTGSDAAAFAQSNDCGATLAVAASCTVNVTFAPSASGSQSAILSIAADGAASPSLVSLDGTGIAPTLAVSPSSLAFGEQRVGSISAAQALTLTNTGTAPLAISGITLSGADGILFGQATDCGASLAAGAACTVSVTFSPSTTGAKSAVLNIAHNAAGSPMAVALSGSGLDSGQPGSSQANTAVSAGEILTINPAAPSAVYWFDPDGSGANAPFLAYADMTTAGGGWLQVRRVAVGNNWYPGNDDLIGTAAYNETGSSTYNASQHWGLKFDYFVNADTEYLFAAGDGSAWCVIRRGGNNFGGTTSTSTLGTTVVDSAGVAVKAGGLTNVLLRSNSEDPWIGCEGAHSQNQSRMFYAEASTFYHVAFKDAHRGINIFVRGKSIINVNPTALAFGDQPVRTHSLAKSVTVTNAGSSVRSISGITLAGVDSDSFSITTTCGASLAVGASCTVSVTFSPSTTGVKSASLSIAYNATGSPTVVALSARGVPSIIVSPESLSFGNRLVGLASRVLTFTVTNPQSRSIVMRGVSVTGADAGSFEQTDDCGSGLANGASCVVSVTFRPTSVGLKTASVEVDTDADDSPAQVVVNGEGSNVIGDTSTNPATSPWQVRTVTPTASSGYYWFDPDGDMQAFRSYSDMSRAGGGWILVRRIAGSGGWYPVDDDLRGHADYQRQYATLTSLYSWSYRFDNFVDDATEYLLSTGDNSAWCVIGRGSNEFNASNDGVGLPLTPVLASFGVGVPAGGYTNVKYGTSWEQPLIGCEGDGLNNTAKMLYAELTSAWSDFKNGHQGINIFVRQPLASTGGEPSGASPVNKASVASMVSEPPSEGSVRTHGVVKGTGAESMSGGVAMALTADIVQSTSSAGSPVTDFESRPLNRQVCGILADGGEELATYRHMAPFSSGTFYSFVAERRQGRRLIHKQALGTGAVFQLGTKILDPVGRIMRCGTITYAWRDGYAPEAWSLSSSLVPFWNKPLLAPSAALRVLSTKCTEDDGLWVSGVTQTPDEQGTAPDTLDVVRIHMSPYADEPTTVTSRKRWSDHMPDLTDGCRPAAERRQARP